MKYLTALWSAVTTGGTAAKLVILIILVAGVAVLAAGVVVSMRTGNDIQRDAQEKVEGGRWYTAGYRL